VSGWTEYRCQNPECEALTIVTIVGATLTDPSYPATDVCGECGDDLYWESGEPAEPPEPDYEAEWERRQQRYEPEGDEW